MMKSQPLIPLALFLALSGILRAEPHKNYPTVDDASETNGDRVIRLSVEVAAPPGAVWRAFTTAEGWKSFAVAFAEVDMKVGGIIETSYNAKARAGDPDNIKNEIVAYIPGRMLAIRCVQAPRDFKHPQEFFSTATVFELAPTEKHTTKVTLTAVGYRPGDAYDALFKMFRWGDAYTLDKLRARFEKPAPGPGADGQVPKQTPPKALSPPSK